MDALDPRHGKPSGYEAHRTDGEPACGDCKAAIAAYEYRLRIDKILGRSRTLPCLGTSRRIQALVAIGWNFTEISERLGRCHDYARKLAMQKDTYVRTTTAERVAEVYEQMSMSLPPTTTGTERRLAAYARRVADRYGWAPPLCWDDIDHDEAPLGMRTSDTRDLLAEWHDLRDAGESIEQAAVRLGVTVGAIERAEYRRKAAA